MNKKQKATLDAIFSKPTKNNIEWSNIEKLFVALGGKISERSGSRIAIRIKDHVGHFHRPHPQKEAKKYQVESARALLIQIGVKP